MRSHMKNLAPRETEESSCVHKTWHLREELPRVPRALRRARGVYQLVIKTLSISSFHPCSRKCAAEWTKAEFDSRKNIEKPNRSENIEVGTELFIFNLEDNTYPRPLLSLTKTLRYTRRWWKVYDQRIMVRFKQRSGIAVIFHRDTTSWLYQAVNPHTCCQWQPTYLAVTRLDVAPCWCRLGSHRWFERTCNQRWHLDQSMRSYLEFGAGRPVARFHNSVIGIQPPQFFSFVRCAAMFGKFFSFFFF